MISSSSSSSSSVIIIVIITFDGEALAILSGDDAHDLFSKTFNFVQKESSLKSARRDQALDN